jgi:hypothetical protein
MTEWYFQATDGTRAGPVDHDAFRKLQAAGELNAETLVWRTGMESWAPLSTVPDSNAPSTSPAESSAPAQSTPATTTFANCTVCNDQWPVNLLRGPDEKRICGNCIRKQDSNPKKAKKAPANNGPSMDYGWGKWWLKIAILTALILISYGIQGFARFKMLKTQRLMEDLQKKDRAEQREQLQELSERKKRFAPQQPER